MRISRRQLFPALALPVLASPLLGSAQDRAARIQLGAQTNTWGVPIKDLDALLSILDTLREIGYTGFETSVHSLSERASQAAEYRRAFESRRMQFIGAHVGARLYDGDAAEKSMAHAVAGWTSEMGASHYILSGRALPEKDGRFDPEAARAKVKALNELGAVCHKRGLKLCYHNHFPEFRGKPMEMDFLLRETDPSVVWLNYDTGNPYGFGPDAAAFSREHFRRIAVYHLKDVVPGENDKNRNVNLGDGKIDMAGVVAPLLDSDWKGWLVVEREGAYPAPSADPAGDQRKCREKIKSLTGI